jgi:Flp pilus assembly protein TadG
MHLSARRTNTIDDGGVGARVGRRDDEGSTTLTTIVVFPLFLACVFGMTQAIQWRHERQMAVAIAQETATGIALYQTDPAAAQQRGTAALAKAGLRSITLEVNSGGAMVQVRVRATAPGILIGTKATVDVSASSTTEAWKK